MSGETMVPANGVDLCVETFGEASDPTVLLIAGGASSMDWWEDEFCRRLAAGGRYVIRYDHRDTGRSTSYPAGHPPYTHVDLADDAVALLDALDRPQAHIVGISMGGGTAQQIAVYHPDRMLSLTLMSTTPGSPYPEDESAAAHEGTEGPSNARDGTAPAADGVADEPAQADDNDRADSSDVDDGTADTAAADDPTGAPEIDWSDRTAVVERLVGEVLSLGGPFTADEPHVRRIAERIFDRTTDMAASQVNHYAAAEGPSIRDRLGTIKVPTLVIHGTVDPMLSLDHAEAFIREIPGAQLLTLEGVGHEHPPAAYWPQVISALLEHTGGR